MEGKRVRTHLVDAPVLDGEFHHACNLNSRGIRISLSLYIYCPCAHTPCVSFPLARNRYTSLSLYYSLPLCLTLLFPFCCWESGSVVIGCLFPVDPEIDPRMPPPLPRATRVADLRTISRSRSQETKRSLFRSRAPVSPVVRNGRNQSNNVLPELHKQRVLLTRGARFSSWCRTRPA